MTPLDALLTSGKTINIKMTFETTDSPARIAHELREFRGLHDSQDFSFATYRIPPIVLLRFPGLLKDDETYIISNIRESDAGDIAYAGHLWSTFFSSHHHPTRQDILDCPGSL